MKTLVLLCLCLFSQIALSAPQQRPKPCKPDIEKFCKGVKPGHGAVIQCLREHESELTPACKSQGEAMKQKLKARGQSIRDVCSTEIDKFCKDAKNPREMVQCLGSHSSELGSECQSILPPGRK